MMNIYSAYQRSCDCCLIGLYIPTYWSRGLKLVRDDFCRHIFSFLAKEAPVADIKWVQYPMKDPDSLWIIPRLNWYSVFTLSYYFLYNLYGDCARHPTSDPSLPTRAVLIFR